MKERRSFSKCFLRERKFRRLPSVDPLSCSSHVLVISRYTSASRAEILWLTKRADVSSFFFSSQRSWSNSLSLLSPLPRFVRASFGFLRIPPAVLLRLNLFDRVVRLFLPLSTPPCDRNFDLRDCKRAARELSFSLSLVIPGRLPRPSFPFSLRVARGFKLDRWSGGSIELLFFSLHLSLSARKYVELVPIIIAVELKLAHNGTTLARYANDISRRGISRRDFLLSFDIVASVVEPKLDARARG